PPSGVAAMPTTGWFSGTPPSEPKPPAAPKGKMPPSRASSQYPWLIDGSADATARTTDGSIVGAAAAWWISPVNPRAPATPVPARAAPTVSRRQARNVAEILARPLLLATGRRDSEADIVTGD